LESEKTILFATDTPSTRSLASELNAELCALPALEAPEDFEAWRAEAMAGPATDRVIVSVWHEAPRSGALVGLDEASWEQRFERPYLLWNIALGAAAGRCRDGGAIVALVQTPAALDSPGWTPEASIGDGVVALTRSLAASEGSRGVRANTVTTPLRFVEGEVIAPTPPLATFPGRLEVEVAGAIRLLLSSDAAGLTGRALAADCGRAFV
jgi:NAD(P)-dependent dehydrogenase (short-subunit alcohol dehydrogenase family)